MLVIADCPTSVIGLTSGGSWMASPCSAPSGAKRAESHRRPKMLQYLLLWHLGTGQQSKFQSTRKTRGSTLSENPVVWLVEISHLEHAQCKNWSPGESFGHSPHWSHWHQSHTPDSLPLVWRTKQKPLPGAYNRHLQKVRQSTVLAHAADNRTWGFTSSTSGSNPWLHWTEVDLFPGSSWSLPALKQQWTSTFILSIDDFWTVASGPDLQVELLPCAASSTRTWVNQRVPLVQRLGCMQDYHLFMLWATWGIFLLAGIAMSSWIGTECSEDFIVLKA